jgi:hypothetical protein
MSRSPFKRYEPAELERFLVAVDELLTRPVKLLVIGGGAAALAYGVRGGTKDIDTFHDTSAIRDVLDEARRKTGLDIPVDYAAVADLPYEFESRVKRALPSLRKLEIQVPEIHDLVLSKVMRGDETDLAAIEEMHARHPLSFEVLVHRFLTEMDHVVGNPSSIEMSFLNCIDTVFGELAREQARRRLAARIR